jgi:ribosomal protein L37AE/L43A
MKVEICDSCGDRIEDRNYLRILAELTVDNKRYIPMQIISEREGSSMCSKCIKEFLILRLGLDNIPCKHCDVPAAGH